MKKMFFAAGLALFFCVNIAGAEVFSLKSDQIGGQLTIDQVYSGFGCTGKNISPQLKWMNAPKNTKSFAITVYDPDAPTGSGWWHWVIFNIPADTSGLMTDAGNPQKNLAPKGSVQSMTDYASRGSAARALLRATSRIAISLRYSPSTFPSSTWMKRPMPRSWGSC